MLRVGDMVRIRLPKNELGITRGMLAYNEAETAIIHASPGKTHKQYILDGVETECGLPYFFVDEWLVPVDVETEVTA